MFLKPPFSARQAVLACAGLTALLGLSSCSLFHHGTRAAAGEATPPAARAPDSATVERPQTATEAATEATGAATGEMPEEAGTTTVISDAGAQVKPGAPRNYVVRRGDTLWGIANMFLRDPWQWPEIWYINPDIRNPHRIYPGDTVRLALRGDGRTALQIVRATTTSSSVGGGALVATRLEPLLRSASLEGPIATIPYSMIAAFLSHPGVLTRDEVKAAPYVLDLPGMHQIAGAGHEVYVKKLIGDSGERFSVMHVDEPLVDPDNGHKLGYLAIYAGTAQLTVPGNIAKMMLTDSARETLQGDVLIPEPASTTTDFAPHVPSQAVSGRVMAVVDNVLLAGQFEVVAINRGAKDGLERGNVLTVDQVRQKVSDQCARIEDSSTCRFHHTETLPTETAGTLLIFKTYDRMSYGLILNESVPIHISDRVRNP
jgi:hypothetical protein